MRIQKTLLIRCFLLGLMAGALILAQVSEPNGAGLRPGVLPEKWLIGGPKCMESPEFQVHEYNEDYYILRQSGCSHYEKPFLHLYFGDEKALLIDTGAGTTEVSRAVKETVDKWLKRKGRESIELVVAHSHGHSDHVAGDSQFQNQPGITFVGPELESVKKFFGFTNWPDQVVQYDLGNRVLDIFGIPGHHEASIAIYDRQTGTLMTGDTVYPGRLYINDSAAFKASVKRMIAFTENKPVAHLLGCHIEQTNKPYLEYPIGSIYQPEEARLELSRGALFELNDAMKGIDGELPRIALRDMTIFPINAEVLAAMRSRRKEVEDRQREGMWNQVEATK